MSDNLIPFGKYKGQPVEVLQNDPSYVDWLRGQDWFRERFAYINQIIINHFGESSETPEHNAIQAKFLKDDFVRAFVRHAFSLIKNVYPDSSYQLPEDFETGSKFEYNGWDVVVQFPVLSHFKEWASLHVEIKPNMGDDFPSVLRQILSYEYVGGGLSKRCLLLESYTGEGATLDEMMKMFQTRGVIVVVQNDIVNAAPKPSA